MKTLLTWHPSNDLKTFDDVFERLLGSPRPSTNASVLPIDLFEQDGKLVVKAAVPGVSPEELDVQIEKNVLTIRGEHKSEAATEDTKIYRREVAYGAFSRSIRLPENLQVDNVDATFSNGIVTISIPKAEEPKPATIKVNVRSAE